MAHNPNAAEAATLRLVLAVSTRCIGRLTLRKGGVKGKGG